MQETSGKTKLKQGMTEEDKEYCADYCPVVDVPGVCRFEDRSDDNG